MVIDDEQVVMRLIVMRTRCNRREHGNVT